MTSNNEIQPFRSAIYPEPQKQITTIEKHKMPQLPGQNISGTDQVKTIFYVKKEH